MAYIGREPQIGNFQVCDAISVVNNQAAYTMQVSSVNVVPESANHMLVSLNGILQQPNSSFTVSSSQIIFASNLVTGDVIDFIHILGSTLDLGVPSDSTVSLAKLTATGTKSSSTFLRGDNSFAEPSGGMTLLSATSVANASSVTINPPFSSTYSSYKIIIAGISPETTNQDLYFTFIKSDGSEETGSNYRFTVGGFRGSNASQEGSESGTSAKWGRNAHNDTGTVNADILITNPQQSIRASVIGVTNKRFTSDATSYAEIFGCWMNTATSYTQIKFFPGSGNWNASGKIMVYGLKEI